MGIALALSGSLAGLPLLESTAVRRDGAQNATSREALQSSKQLEVSTTFFRGGYDFRRRDKRRAENKTKVVGQPSHLAYRRGLGWGPRRRRMPSHGADTVGG